MKKNKIINDPVYGFITFPSELIFQIIDHPWFQRLRRIKQLGLTDLVYPGANHTRFHHTIGATYLMTVALNTLKNKDIPITDEEMEAAMIAILLHDVGHGPFSHALEFGLITSVTHEDISLLIMKKLNEEFNGQLELAIKIFSDQYERKFFHQLVSGQLDVDRLDYLTRDSYFTGVTEGVVSFDRILKMLNVHNDQLVVEEKGVYSIENFLNARRLMYWQVYLHKTVISAEFMLLRVIQRVKELYLEQKEVYIPELLHRFIEKNVTKLEFEQQPEFLRDFVQLDDNDIWSAVKVWQHNEDIALRTLCHGILHRALFKIEIQSGEISPKRRKEIHEQVQTRFEVDNTALDYLVIKGNLSNSAYLPREKNINILTKSGIIKDVSKATDLPNIQAMSQPVHKSFICWPAPPKEKTASQTIKTDH